MCMCEGFHDCVAHHDGAVTKGAPSCCFSAPLVQTQNSDPVAILVAVNHQIFPEYFNNIDAKNSNTDASKRVE